MLLLATQAEPQMIEHAHPNLGRLIQPRHYNALAATIERGVPSGSGQIRLPDESRHLMC